MAELIVYTTTRHRCPHCRRSYRHRKPAERHLARCISSPERRTCRTCKHGLGRDGIEPRYTGGYVTECAVDEDIYQAVCGDCGAEVLPLPGVCPNGCDSKPLGYLRVLCPRWEPREVTR